MLVDRTAYTAMIDHMVQAAPEEGVGLLAGLARRCPRDTDGDGNCGRRWCPDCGGGVEHVCDTWLPLRNSAEFPRLRYEADPGELVGAWNALETTGRRPWIVCHSHVRDTTAPSELDIMLAGDRTLHHFVVSLLGTEPVAALWYLDPFTRGRDQVRRVRDQVVDLGFQVKGNSDLTHGVTEA